MADRVIGKSASSEPRPKMRDGAREIACTTTISYM